MPALPEISTKRLAISKASAQMVGIVAAASFITVFCLIASKSVFSNNQYNARVTDKKQAALTQLEDNLEAYDKLRVSYAAFDNASQNVIGGNRTGTDDRDGSNSKIILDALPSSYDYPAVTSTIEKLVRDRGLQLTELTGLDDEVAQQTNTTSSDPKTIDIPFTFSVENASYASVAGLLDDMQRSIRPIIVDKLTVSGPVSSMTFDVSAHTYFQPGKSVDIKKEVVK